MGNSYVYNDVVPVSGDVFYRIEIIDNDYHNYSNIILLSTNVIALNISGLVNPFNHSISFNMTVPDDNSIQLNLFDAYGRRLVTVKRQHTKELIILK